jgi:hypothetical protein
MWSAGRGPPGVMIESELPSGVIFFIWKFLLCAPSVPVADVGSLFVRCGKAVRGYPPKARNNRVMFA